LGLAEFFSNNIQKIGIQPNSNVLDVGCGISPIGIFLADQYNCSVTGVELNPIAADCAISNIKKYKLNSQIVIHNINFIDYTNQYTGGKYKVIVANPPIDEIVTTEKIAKYNNYDFSILNDEAFSYLTNSWHSSDGRDLTDYIFEFGVNNLDDDGYIYIVFCNIDCKSPSYVIEKGKKYGFIYDNIYEDVIMPESIGFHSGNKDEIKAYIIRFREVNYGYIS
jgi:methylase of polypeptide subunit release factors